MALFSEATTRVRFWTVIAMGGVAGFGCGGTEGPPPILPADFESQAPAPPAPVHISGDRTAEGDVGSPGGTFSLGNGARLEVPEDALSDEVHLSFSVAGQTQAFSNRDDIQLIGPSVMAMPPLTAVDGIFFEVSAPIPNLPRDVSPDAVQLAIETVDSHQRVGSSATTQTHWEFVAASVTGVRATAAVPTLPGQRFQFVVAP